MGDNMDDTPNVNNIDQTELGISSSQPVLPSQSSQSSKTLKRPEPESPDMLLATQKQKSRQIRPKHSNSLSDLRELTSKRGPASKKTIADKVLEALTSFDVLNKVIPILSDKISESISLLIDDKIQAAVTPLNQTIAEQKQIIDSQKEKICSQFIKIQSLESAVYHHVSSLAEHTKEIDHAYDRIASLESRIEAQEQYSRRTSLRFHNVKVPVDYRGRIKHPVNTDKLILDICKNKLKLDDVTLEDISRSHVIGRAYDGKAQVIVRFLSYRVRHKVYSSKRALKNDPEGHYITENLTQFRNNLVKKLSNFKYEKKIHSYWTVDGRIFATKSETGKRHIINNWDDIVHIEHLQEEARPDSAQHETSMDQTEPDGQQSDEST